jgi:hypothetical protein
MKTCITLFHSSLRSLTLLVGLALFASSAHAATQARVDITYTNGQIVSGPLSADLDVLPASVHAFFLLNGTSSGGYDIGDVAEASLTFGDGAWDQGDLDTFSATLIPTDAGGLGAMALTYSYKAIDTAHTNGRLAANFPLEIQGTDIASGMAFDYLYDMSMQTVTLVPEPATGLALLIAATTLLFRRESRAFAIAPSNPPQG